MRRTLKSLAALRALLRDLAAEGSLDAGQSEALDKALKGLEHAFKVRDQRRVAAEADKLARTLLKNMLQR